METHITVHVNACIHMQKRMTVWLYLGWTHSFLLNTGVRKSNRQTGTYACICHLQLLHGTLPSTKYTPVIAVLNSTLKALVKNQERSLPGLSLRKKRSNTTQPAARPRWAGNNHLRGHAACDGRSSFYCVLLTNWLPLASLTGR